MPVRTRVVRETLSERIAYPRAMHRLAIVLLFVGCGSAPPADERPRSEPAPSGAACEVYASCGCERGCAFFATESGPGGLVMYRDESRALYARPDARYPLYRASGEDCEESCPETPATTRCAVVDGACTVAR